MNADQRCKIKNQHSIYEGKFSFLEEEVMRVIFGVQIKLCLFKIVHFCLLLLSEVYIILKSKKATNSDGIEEKSYPPW